MAADLAWLEKSFNWEVRVMWLVPVGVVFFVISEDVAIIFMGVAMLGILITDSLFTDIATTAFFRPWPLAVGRSQRLYSGVGIFSCCYLSLDSSDISRGSVLN